MGKGSCFLLALPSIFIPSLGSGLLGLDGPAEAWDGDQEEGVFSFLFLPIETAFRSRISSLP
jgi:hypothetical protein